MWCDYRARGVHRQASGTWVRHCDDRPGEQYLISHVVEASAPRPKRGGLRAHGLHLNLIHGVLANLELPDEARRPRLRAHAMISKPSNLFELLVTMTHPRD